MNRYDKTHNLVGEEAKWDKLIKGINIGISFVILIIALYGTFILAYGLDAAITK